MTEETNQPPHDCACGAVEPLGIEDAKEFLDALANDTTRQWLGKHGVDLKGGVDPQKAVQIAKLVCSIAIPVCKFVLQL